MAQIDVSDLHANPEALASAFPHMLEFHYKLKAAGGKGVSAVNVLGDIVGYGDGHGAQLLLEKLFSYSEVLGDLGIKMNFLAGNHDRPIIYALENGLESMTDSSLALVNDVASAANTHTLNTLFEGAISVDGKIEPEKFSVDQKFYHEFFGALENNRDGVLLDVDLSIDPRLVRVDGSTEYGTDAEGDDWLDDEDESEQHITTVNLEKSQLPALYNRDGKTVYVAFHSDPFAQKTERGDFIDWYVFDDNQLKVKTPKSNYIRASSAAKQVRAMVQAMEGSDYKSVRKIIARHGHTHLASRQLLRGSAGEPDVLMVDTGTLGMPRNNVFAIRDFNKVKNPYEWATFVVISEEGDPQVPEFKDSRAYHMMVQYDFKKTAQRMQDAGLALPVGWEEELVEKHGG